MAGTGDWPGCHGYEFLCVAFPHYGAARFREVNSVKVDAIGCTRLFYGAQLQDEGSLLVRGYIESRWPEPPSIGLLNIYVETASHQFKYRLEDITIMPCIRFDALYRELLTTCKTFPLQTDAKWTVPSIPYFATTYGIRSIIAAGGSYDGVCLAREYMTTNEAARSERPNVVWYHGDSPRSVIKEARRFASEVCSRRHFRMVNVYENTRGETEWDGYDGHVITILHNVYALRWSAATLAALCGDEPVRVQQSRGTRQFRSQYLIIIASDEPTAEYGDHPDFIELRSSINEVVRVPVPTVGASV